MNYLIINLKTYQEGSNKNAQKIAKSVKELEEKAKEKDTKIILCPQAIDIKETKAENIEIYSQHIDSFKAGAHTGHIIAENLKEIGISGSLISHSEHILNLEEIKERIDILKELDLMSCVCARDDRAAKEISKFKPNFIAVEPKELIGGDISISNARPELIEESLKAIDNQALLLVGAGVKDSNDVRKALELGARGILVASGVVKHENPKEAIEELLDGF